MPHQDWLQDYQESNIGQVLLENDNACKVVSNRALDILTLNGSKMKLEDVRYVPDLNRNLILLSMFDAKGYDFRVDNRVLKVTRGSMMVLKGSRANKLCIIDGKTVVRSSSIASREVEDYTMLLHRRLGYMSE